MSGAVPAIALFLINEARRRRLAQQMRCPRRDESTLGRQKAGDVDSWGENNDRCSYCGSMHPDAFMAAIEAGKEIGPTDKDYKVYVDVDGYTEKFYFQHLSPERRREFIGRLNAKTLKIRHPGRFYVLPFFCVRVE